MKKFIKNNVKIISTIIVTVVLCISGTVYATTKYLSSDVTYKDTTVENALDELYIERTISKTYDAAAGTSPNDTANAVGNNFEKNKKYLCFLQYTNDVNNLSVKGADLIFYNYDGGHLDYRYATEVAYIKATSNVVTFSISGARGIGVRCWKV